MTREQLKSTSCDRLTRSGSLLLCVSAIHSLSCCQEKVLVVGALRWFAGMVRWKSVLQTDTEAAAFAGAHVGECEELFAALDGASFLLFLQGITVP